MRTDRMKQGKSTVSQGEPTENGNRVSVGVQKYKYDFVLNNYTEDEVSQVSQTLRRIAKKAVVGKEVGESGTPHLQGYFSLIKKERMTSLVKHAGFARASFRECRNEEALIAYCQKENNIILSIGLPKPISIIKELYPWQKKIEDVYHTEPDNRSIYWFWESTGNVGKSAFVKYMVVKHNALFCDGGKKNDLINLVFNNDMDNCKCVIWDLPRSTKGMVSYSTLESIKNGLVCNTKYETGTKAFNPPHIFVFANYPPDDETQLSKDRWRIYELPDLQLIDI